MSAAAGNPLPVPMPMFFALLAIGFPMLWCAILWIIAAMGWRRVANAFPATSDPPLSAERIGWASLAIGSPPLASNYGNCVNGWITESGMWLRPVLIFRPFHPMIHIPWARIRAIESGRLLGFARTRLDLGTGLPPVTLTGRLAKAVLARGPVSERRSKTSP